MEGTWRDGAIVVGGDARQRFHDARGYGRPLEGNEVALAPVEAAHLLVRGDLDSVDGDGFAAVLAAAGEDAVAHFLAYADLRSRGFYLSPARAGWTDSPRDDLDFVVYRRGDRPPDGALAHRIRVVGERATVSATGLGDVTLAVVDEEGEVTYLGTGRPDPSGEAAVDPPAATGRLLADRVLVTDPPPGLHGGGFFGQPLDGGDHLLLSLVEAAYLADRGALSVEGSVAARGRAVEGDRFDRRLAVYAALRSRGLVPKTGFKFGADFRVYDEFESLDELGHSASLVRVLPPDHAFTPRELALDVRLASGVRKRMVFASPGGDGVDWLAVARRTP